MPIFRKLSSKREDSSNDEDRPFTEYFAQVRHNIHINQMTDAEVRSISHAFGSLDLRMNHKHYGIPIYAFWNPAKFPPTESYIGENALFILENGIDYQVFVILIDDYGRPLPNQSDCRRWT